MVRVVRTRFLCDCLMLHRLLWRQITGWIDKGLNEKAYIIPGLGDFGERRCGIAFCWNEKSGLTVVLVDTALERSLLRKEVVYRVWALIRNEIEK